MNKLIVLLFLFMIPKAAEAARCEPSSTDGSAAFRLPDGDPARAKEVLEKAIAAWTCWSKESAASGRAVRLACATVSVPEKESNLDGAVAREKSCDAVREQLKAAVIARVRGDSVLRESVSPNGEEVDDELIERSVSDTRRDIRLGAGQAGTMVLVERDAEEEKIPVLPAAKRPAVLEGDQKVMIMVPEQQETEEEAAFALEATAGFLRANGRTHLGAILSSRAFLLSGEPSPSTRAGFTMHGEVDTFVGDRRYRLADNLSAPVISNVRAGLGGYFGFAPLTIHLSIGAGVLLPLATFAPIASLSVELRVAKNAFIAARGDLRPGVWSDRIDWSPFSGTFGLGVEL
jgi:hypothetical protein